MDSNIFEEIKSKLDIIEVAKYYGIELNKQNKCCCPFHTEKTPSFSISRKKQMFHCFGCNISGDVISLTQNLLHLSTSLDAVRQLDTDFSLGLNLSPHKPTKKERQKQAARSQRKFLIMKWDEWKDTAIRNVIEYIKLLEQFRTDFAPKNINEELHPLFIKSCQEIDFTEYLYDCMIQADEKEWQDIFKTNKKEVERIVEEVQKIRSTKKS